MRRGTTGPREGNKNKGFFGFGSWHGAGGVEWTGVQSPNKQKQQRPPLLQPTPRRAPVFFRLSSTGQAAIVVFPPRQSSSLVGGRLVALVAILVFSIQTGWVQKQSEMSPPPPLAAPHTPPPAFGLLASETQVALPAPARRNTPNR